MSSNPLGVRATLKGPQVHKRVMMKPQAATYYVQVKLPAELQRSLRNSSDMPSAGVSHLADGSSMLHTEASGATTGFSASRASSPMLGSAVRLPALTEEELSSNSYMASFRGVVTVTVPSAASCAEVIQCILVACHAVDRPPSDYQLVQCFADFSPDNTRRRLTGDSTKMPVKMVLQFPFQLALVLSPFVTLREKVCREEEPLGRSAVVEEYRRVVLTFIQGYQSLLVRMIEQSHFLRGREEEGRRGKKLEERQQFFELARFRTQTDEKGNRMNIARALEPMQRTLIGTMELAFREKLLWCDPERSELLSEHRRFIERTTREHRRLLEQGALLDRLQHRLQMFFALRDAMADDVTTAKLQCYTVSRIATNIDAALSADDDGRTTPGDVESRRRRLAPHLLPGYYPPDCRDIEHHEALLRDVHSSARSFVLLSPKNNESR